MQLNTKVMITAILVLKNCATVAPTAPPSIPNPAVDPAANANLFVPKKYLSNSIRVNSDLVTQKHMLATAMARTMASRLSSLMIRTK